MKTGKTKAKKPPKTKAAFLKPDHGAPASALEESYNEFPYESFVYPQSHPERMHTIARLFKLGAPDIHKARILELGCAGGGNLIPLALLYPDTRCAGIDFSADQIALADEGKK